MANDLAIIIPCRGRPHKLTEVFAAAYDTKTKATFYIGIDNDDADRMAYIDACVAASHIADIEIVMGDRIRMCPTLNKIAMMAAYRHKYLGFMGDDHLPRTERWVDKIIEGLKYPMSIVYGNDLLQGEALPTAVFMDSHIIRKLGYMCPPSLIHLYADNFWKDLGNALGTLTYMPDVIIEHMHFTAGKSQEDAQYQEVNSTKIYNADAESYRLYKETQFQIDVNKLKNEMGN